MKHTKPIYFPYPQNGFDPSYSREFQSQHTIQQCKLPQGMIEICKEKYEDKLSSESMLLSNQWSLIFRFSAKMGHVTAFHPEFHLHQTHFQKKNSTTITGKLVRQYRGYNFKIPTLPYLCRHPSIYLKTVEQLYSFQIETIYSMNLKNKNKDEWKWDFWKTENGMKIEEGASICSVDNDKFIACINADGKKSYLFAMNEKKLSIRIADACKFRIDAKSMYHDSYHKIITIGKHTGEWYDINKGKSTIFADFRLHYPQEVYYSPLDPSIIYCVSCQQIAHGGTNFNGQDIQLLVIDLREGKSQFRDYTPKDPYYSGFNGCSVSYLRF